MPYDFYYGIDVPSGYRIYAKCKTHYQRDNATGKLIKNNHKYIVIKDDNYFYVCDGGNKI